MSIDLLRHGELIDLLEHVCCGEATAADFDRIEELVSGDAQARRIYVRYLDLHAQLDWSRREREVAVAPQRDAAIICEDSRQPVSRVIGFMHKAVWQVRRTVTEYRAALAILLLLAIVPLFLWRMYLSSRADAARGKPGDPVAKSDGNGGSNAANLPRHPLPSPIRAEAGGDGASRASPPREPDFPNVPSFPIETPKGAHPTGPMLDPATDKPDRPWCYLAKSTTVIGMPEQPDVTQITFDGAMFTRRAELCFFYGPQDRPLLAREKTFLEGWIPVVQYAWREGDIAYDIEYFAAPLEGENRDNTVNFAQVRMKNTGHRTAAGTIVAALRNNGEDGRFREEYNSRPTPFSPGWRYEMTSDAAIRDGQLTYAFTPGAAREAVPGTVYWGPFLGSQHFITSRAECCLTRYQKDLKPGETFAATFKMPRVPVNTSEFNTKVLAADYQAYRAGTIAYWKKLFAGGGAYEFPEKRVQDAQRASVVHVLLATRKLGDSWTQTDGLQYPSFFITSAPQMTLAYLQSGQFDRAKKVVERAISWQKANGLYQDYWLAQGAEIPAGHGHGMFAAAMTVVYSQDKAFAEKVYPSLKKAVQYIADSIAKDEYGLLPPAYPYDNERINGHYTSNNLWALLGLRNAVRVARLLGKTDDVVAWSKLEERYAANIRKGIAASAKPDGYVPPGLYKYLTGPAARSGLAEWETNQDWENMLLAFPCELLPPSEPRVRGTVDHIRKNYAEGIMPYRDCLHQYITANQIEQYLALGDNYTALKDFYHLMLHCGSTQEGFEFRVRPWSDRQIAPDAPPPHAWASSKLACLARDLVLLEYGGKAGMEPGKRELWLFHCLSPAWTRPGDQIAIRNAATEFGRVNAKMRFDAQGAAVAMSGKFHDPPAAYRLRVPYFKELTAFKTDAKQSRRDGDCIVLSPDATTARLEWRDKPGANLHTIENILTDYRSANRNRGPDAKGLAVIEPGKVFLEDDEKSGKPQPLSFATVREAFRHEYARMADEADELVKVEAPPMLAANERRGSFVRQFGFPQANVTTGCKVEASSYEAGHPPENAVDGVVSLESSWWASPYPQWLKLDLGRLVRLKGIRVWPYWGAGRYYQYCVEISTDGKDWTLVGDRGKNTTPATEAGDEFLFAATEVRFIRVRMLYNNVNAGVHIVEVMGIEAKGGESSRKELKERKVLK